MERCIPALLARAPGHVAVGECGGEGLQARPSMGMGKGLSFGCRHMSGFQGGSTVRQKPEEGKPDPLEQYGKLLETTLKREEVSDAEGHSFARRLNKTLASQKLGVAMYETKALDGEEHKKKGATFGSEVTISGDFGVKKYFGRGMTTADAENAAAHMAMLGLEVDGILKRVRRQEGRGKTSLKLNPPADVQWNEVDMVPQKLIAVAEERVVPIPELAHGLDRILHHDNKVATSLKKKFGGKGIDKEYCKHHVFSLMSA